MPRAWNLFRYAQIKIKLKANSVTSPRSDVSGNVWHTRAHARIHIHTHRLLGWNEYVIEIWHCAANPGQDLLTLSLTLSHSVCLSAYLLTKELSLCLSGRIVLNGDFLCNHLIIHQFPKKPQRGCISTLCWRAQQWETGGRKGGGFPGGNDQNGFQLLYLLQVSAFSLVLALPTYAFPKCEVLLLIFLCLIYLPQTGLLPTQ